MTKQEAITILEDNFLDPYYSEEKCEAVNMAINALSADGDLISRKGAEQCCLNGWNKDYKAILEDIRKLPSAEKTAEWVKNGSYYQCSNCYEWAIEDVENCQIRSRFCPNCGAKMVESEEVG